MKCNRDSSLAYREIVSLISSAKLEWISVSCRLLDKPQGRDEFQDLLDTWKYLLEVYFGTSQNTGVKSERGVGSSS